MGTVIPAASDAQSALAATEQSTWGNHSQECIDYCSGHCIPSRCAILNRNLVASCACEILGHLTVGKATTRDASGVSSLVACTGFLKLLVMAYIFEVRAIHD